MILLLSLACSDFGLSQMKEPHGMPDEQDTAAPLDTSAEDLDTGTPPEDTGAVPSADSEPAADTGGDVPATDTGDDPPPADDCAETDALVYVISRDDGTLYTFDPAALSFTSLGRVNCGTSQTPGSMSVSRDGVAYVRYADNSLYGLDLATMTCSRTAYSDRSGFDSFGMGYSTDSADTWREQLFVANADTLGTLDTSTGVITTVGRMSSQSELTGDADGELWAMLPLESPAEIVQLDKSTGSTLSSIRLPSFPDPGDIDAFAFATWSGDFYVFVREYGMGSSTDVYKVTSAGTMTKVLTDVGFDVVGAGTSTCAPS